MKLKRKIRYARKSPKPGDIRVINRFAWFPVVLYTDKFTKLWLEPYKVVQIFRNNGSYRFYGRGMSWSDRWEWSDDVYLPMNCPPMSRLLVEERRRIKEEIKKGPPPPTAVALRK